MTVGGNKNGDEVAAEAEKPQWDRKYPPEAQLLLGRPQKISNMKLVLHKIYKWDENMKYIHSKYSPEAQLR